MLKNERPWSWNSRGCWPLVLQELSDEDVVVGCHDDERMLTAAAAASSCKLSLDSLGCSTQRASSGTHRPTALCQRAPCYPCPLQRCGSERGPDEGGGLEASQYRSCAELDGTLQAAAWSSTHHPLQRPTRRPSAVSPLRRRDIFYSGSVVSLGTHSRQNVDNDTTAVVDDPDQVHSAIV